MRYDNQKIFLIQEPSNETVEKPYFQTGSKGDGLSLRPIFTLNAAEANFQIEDIHPLTLLLIGGWHYYKTYLSCGIAYVFLENIVFRSYVFITNTTKIGRRRKTYIPTAK